MADGKIDSGKLKELWKKGQDAQSRWITNEAVNTAFNAGDQWVAPDRDRGYAGLTQVARDPERVRATVNRIGPATRSLLAKLARRPLVFEIPPPGADDASVRKAKKAEAALADAHERMQWEDIRQENDNLALLGGTGVLMVDWDPKAGVEAGEHEGKTVFTGDVLVSAASVAQIVVAPGTKNARFAPWCIRGDALPPEEVQSLFGLKKEPSADAASTMTQVSVSDLTRQDRSPNTKLTAVYRYYRRPSGKGDRGEVAVMVNGDIVQTAPWPYPFTDHLPLAVERETLLPGKWMGDTIVTDAVPVQTLYNAAWSGLIEHAKNAGFAFGITPDGNVEIVDELADIPGAWYSYNSGPDGGKPEYVSPPQLPQWLVDQPAMLRRELDDILSVQEAARGGAPANIESGLGVQILVEQADTPIERLAQSTARAWSDIASDVLALYGKYATETRKAEVSAPSRPTQVVSWSKADLEGLGRAKVPYEAILPKSRAAQQALAMSLWDKQIVTDPLTIAEIGDLPDKESFIVAVDPDVAKAMRENYDMGTGADPFLQDFDDHAKHIATHNRFRKSEEYRNMAPAGRKKVDNHIVDHEEAAAADQIEATAAEATSPLGAAPPLASEADLTLLPADPAMGDPADPMAAEMPLEEVPL